MIGALPLLIAIGARKRARQSQKLLKSTLKWGRSGRWEWASLPDLAARDLDVYGDAAGASFKISSQSNGHVVRLIRQWRSSYLRDRYNEASW